MEIEHTKQNWTKNQKLSDAVDKLDMLTEDFLLLGETSLSAILSAVIIARICDEDGEPRAINEFKLPTVKILLAAKYIYE